MSLLAQVASNNSGVIIAAISTGGAVVATLGAALINISRLSKKTDKVAKVAEATAVQVNGHMTTLIAQLEAANAARLAVEVELARMKALHPE